MPEKPENTPVATSQQNTEKEVELPPQEAVEVVEKESEKTAKKDDFVEDNKMIADENPPNAYKMSSVDHGGDANGMVAEEHIPETAEMIHEECIDDIDITKDETAKSEEAPVAAETVKLSENDVEELQANVSIWENMAYRDFQELQGDMECKNWQLAFITARKLVSHLEMLKNGK